MGDLVGPEQVVVGLAPVFLEVGQLLVVGDHQQVVVGLVAALGIVDPVAARVASEQDDLEDPPGLAVRGVAAFERVLELGEQDLHDAGELVSLGVRQMVEAGLHLGRGPVGVAGVR